MTNVECFTRQKELKKGHMHTTKNNATLTCFALAISDLLDTYVSTSYTIETELMGMKYQPPQRNAAVEIIEVGL